MNNIISKCTDSKRHIKSNIFMVGLYLTLLSISLYVLYNQVLTIKRESLWFDESISFLAAKLPLAQILNNSIQDPHPPFYYVLLHWWFNIVSEGDANGRLLNVLLNIGIILLVYWLAKIMLNSWKLALIAAGLSVISPFQMLYTHELRMYTLLMFLTMAMIIAYWKARQNQQGYWWILFAVFAVLAMHTHLFTAFALMAVGIYALLHWREKTSLLKTITVGIFIILLFLPWIYLLAGESQIAVGSLRPLQSDAELFNPIKPITSIAFLLFGQANTLWYGGIAFFLVLAITIILLLDLYKAYKQGEDISFLQLPGLLVLLVIGVPNIVYFINPFFLPERTMAAAAPFMLILLAWGASRKHSPLPYLVGATAVTMLIGTTIYLTTDSLIKPPYRDAIEFVAQQHHQDDTILHTSDGSYLPSLSYVNLPNHILLAGDPDMRKPIPVYQAFGGEVWEREEIVTMANRLWLVVALEHSIEWQQEQVDYFHEQYSLLEIYDFDGIHVYLYNSSFR